MGKKNCDIKNCDIKNCDIKNCDIGGGGHPDIGEWGYWGVVEKRIKREVMK